MTGFFNKGHHGEPIKRSHIWFDDGSIIIQAEDTQFCVHKSVVLKHFPTLNDFVPSPGPPSANGCSVIWHLSDSAEDWENLLTVFYDTLPTCTTKDLISFRLLAAMLRLGDKYNGHNVREEALKFLRYEFPQNLEDWMGVWGTKVFPYPESEFDFINLAQEVDLHSVLPAMYYTCVKYEKLNDVFHGYTNTDGSITQLSPKVQACLAIGREQLAYALKRHTFSWLYNKRIIPCPRCSSQKECAAARNHLIRKVWMPVPNIGLALNVWDRGEFASGLCSVCAYTAEKLFRSGQDKLWDELPSYFGLPSWDDLQDFDDSGSSLLPSS
ncbi:uncharacterized protein LACBIDRAFT_323434 [Laccaria bicolor S238N-H82]|uniref:Predicted protein n=1 Tax=Laccaria bicolor (strain S238N-H82 / ATCC MYA-4686) TaxID=486041 RepID=B0CXL7_LACBS|nr:uncharacterized protein LACBIDRAFT_323434 [Laccaria bicolor S238N-H82]EDR12744.1 predicted protein [Laccaria bicolor S238N-H82]|eukprot:XP_001877008.1 predicted protein [Laccaria bicolor S238N-H82]